MPDSFISVLLETANVTKTNPKSNGGAFLAAIISALWTAVIPVNGAALRPASSAALSLSCFAL